MWVDGPKGLEHLPLIFPSPQQGAGFEVEQLGPEPVSRGMPHFREQLKPQFGFLKSPLTPKIGFFRFRFYAVCTVVFRKFIGNAYDRSIYGFQKCFVPLSTFKH